MVHIIDNRDVHEIPFKDIKVGDFFEDNCDNIYIKTMDNNNIDRYYHNAFCVSQKCSLKMDDDDYFRILNVTIEVSYIEEDIR